MPTWRPRGSGWRSSSSVVSNSASVLSTRSTPAWRSSASTAASSPSAPAVCDSASPGRRPRLPLTARIGFSRETRREICEKRRGLPKDSTYSAMTRAARVVGPVLEEVVRRDVRAVAERDEGGDPEPPRGGVAEQREPERAGLRRQREAAPPRVDLAEQRVQVDRRVGVDEADAVRPDEAHAAGPRRREQRLLALAALGLVGVREAGRDDEHAAGARVGGLDDRVEHLGRRDGHEHELGRVGELADRRHRADRGHDPAAATHRRRHAGEPARDDRPQQLAADAALARRGADDSDGRGREHRAQRRDGGRVVALGDALLEPIARADVELEVGLADAVERRMPNPRSRRRRASRGCRP